MKTLKFMPELCDQILAGTKTSTWRPFDDKNLSVGDEITFINKGTLEEFGTGKITKVTVRTFETLTDADWGGHERYASDEAMYETYRGYFPEKEVNGDTEVKLISFIFSPTT